MSYKHIGLTLGALLGISVGVMLPEILTALTPAKTECTTCKELKCEVFDIVDRLNNIDAWIEATDSK